jgi:hypothetical protein
MVKAMKFVVLASGVIGLIAFFLPLIAVEKSGVEGKLSAFQIVKGIDAVQEVVKEAPKTGSAEETKAVGELNDGLDEVKGIVLAVFGPAAILALLGVIAVARKRFGRGMAIPTFLIGLIGLGIWALLNAAANEVGGDENVKGLGMHLLMLTGLGGTFAGLVGTIKPDRG